VFVCGVDAFLGISKWFESEKLSSLCHFVVANRGERPLLAQEVLSPWQLTSSIDRLASQSAGLVYSLQMPVMKHASSKIRQDLQSDLVPENVWQYIQAQGLYSTKDIQKS